MTKHRSHSAAFLLFSWEPGANTAPLPLGESGASEIKGGSGRHRQDALELDGAEPRYQMRSQDGVSLQGAFSAPTAGLDRPGGAGCCHEPHQSRCLATTVVIRNPAHLAKIVASVNLWPA